MFMNDILNLVNSLETALHFENIVYFQRDTLVLWFEHINTRPFL